MRPRLRPLGLAALAAWLAAPVGVAIDVPKAAAAQQRGSVSEGVTVNSPESEEHQNFAQDIVEQFSKSTVKATVIAEATAKKKPILALLMTKWCDACLVLRASINSGQHVRGLLPHFVTVYGDTDELIKAWEKDSGYIPQAVFMSSDGKVLDIVGPSKEHGSFYGDDSTLAHGMLKALRLVGHPAAEGLSDAFDADVAQHFSDATDKEAVFSKARREGKPVMALLLSKVSWESMSLRSSINNGRQVKWLLPGFVVVYLEHKFDEWKEENHHYIPQANFFDMDGKRLHVTNVAGYKHYFSDEVELAAGMRRALALTSGKSGAGNLLTGKLPSPFDDEVNDHIRPTWDPQELGRMGMTERKPLMIIVTQPWCKVCKDLVQSIKDGEGVRTRLAGFIVAHAQGDAAVSKWQEPGENYVPQVHFLDHGGSYLGIEGPNPAYKRFFSSDEEVAAAMDRALTAMSKREL